MSEIHLSYVGYFQFENLVKNRVPFALLNLGSDIESCVGKRPEDKQDLDFLSRHEIKISAGDILTSPKNFVSNHRLDKNQPIVFVCNDGHDSEKAAQEIEKLGFINVFVLRNGVTGFLKEKEQFTK